MLNLIQFTD